MAAEIEFSTAPWIRNTGSPDPNGPLDLPYTPYNQDWLNRPLVDVIGEIAQRMSDQIAIDDGAIRLTYSQLYAMACRLSHAIARADLSPGPIGILLPNDAFYVVAMLGSLAAGRPCLLLSQDNPQNYNQNLIEKSALAALIVNAAEARTASATGGPHRIPIETALMTGGDRDECPAGRLGPDDPAFILSTSGSTGVPKLLARSQRDVQRRASKTIDAERYSENDRVLTLGAPAAGSAVGRRFTPLLAGATLHIIDVPRAGMGGILRVVRDDRITVMRATSSLIKALSQLDNIRAHLASLRLVWSGGEVLLQVDIARLRPLLPPGCLIGHGLNLTETSVAGWFVPEPDDHDPFRVAAGYIVPETDALILDDNGCPSPIGEVGELIIRSESVALGEWVDGQVVPDRFQRDPTDPTKRIYRTGDLARICPDGVLVVHGRKDRMIKIRGQRVEPAVVEAVIRNVPGVADAAVAAKQIDDEIRLFGFVAPRPEAGDGLVAAIQSAVKTALPSYMQPSEIHLADSLPINAGGKVDIKSLLESVGAAGVRMPAVDP